jgi:hypothetical protein
VFYQKTIIVRINGALPLIGIASISTSVRAPIREKQTIMSHSTSVPPWSCTQTHHQIRKWTKRARGMQSEFFSSIVRVARFNPGSH